MPLLKADLQRRIPDGRRGKIEEAVRSCPVSALSIDDQ
jgi:ferredoxin